MVQVGDQVVYGIHGVCNVVEEEKRVVDKKQVTYLVLEPLCQSGSRYLVPTHNAAAMAKLSPMLSRMDMEQLLSSPEIRQDSWIKDENHRKQTYRELISSGNRKKLMSMVYTLYQHKSSQTAAGRKCHLCDENFLRDAEKLLASELAVVMEVTQEEARQYLRRQLKAE